MKPYNTIYRNVLVILGCILLPYIESGNRKNMKIDKMQGQTKWNTYDKLSFKFYWTSWCYIVNYKPKNAIFIIKYCNLKLFSCQTVKNGVSYKWGFEFQKIYRSWTFYLDKKNKVAREDLMRQEVTSQISQRDIKPYFDITSVPMSLIICC